MAPFVVASYDIECVSLENRFPIAKKSWKKVAIDIINNAQNLYNYIKSRTAIIHAGTDYDVKNILRPQLL